MSYNKEAGYGSKQVQALTAPVTGKTFYVVKSAQPNNAALAEMLTPDTEWVPRMYTTLTAALAQCVASRGDVIYIAPWYTETLSAANTTYFAIAGVTIIGLGTGSLRPTFTLDTATSAAYGVSAANISISNCLFIANFADIATCFLLSTAKDFVLSNCEFRDTSSVLNFINIVKTGSTANASDGLQVRNNRMSILWTTALTTPVNVLCTTDRIIIDDNYVTKAVLNNTSCLLKHAALVVTNLEMARNRIFSANTDSATGGFLITTTSTTNSGMVFDNYVQGLDVAGAILVTAGSVYGMFNNLYDGDADKSGFVLPAIGGD